MINFYEVVENKTERKNKCLIQVCYLMKDESTLKREYEAFAKINDNSPKYVFSLDKKDTSQNGITHINIIDFLTKKIDINLS